MKHFILFLSTLLLVPSAFSLVDYSDNSGAIEEDSPAPLPNSVQSRVKSSRRSRGKAAPKFLNVGTKYSSINLENGDNSGKVNLLEVNAHIQTLYNIFAELSYFGAQTSDTDVAENTSYQAGNPAFKLGFNWLQLGQGAGSANIDLYGGVMMKTSNSDFASSRNDTLFGALTSKRIDRFIIALEGEMRLTGSPSAGEDLDIGNISHIKGGIGWMVSPDIRIATEFSAYKVAKSDNLDGNRLEKDLSFSLVSPTLYLTMGRNVELELGAHFRMQRPISDQNLVQAKLIDVPGVYGNSIFGGFNVSI